VGRLTRARAGVVALAVIAATSAGVAQDAGDPSALVRQLRQFEPAIAVRTTPAEQRRADVYAKLRVLGSKAVPALQEGLTDRDVRVRRNVALYLSWAGGGYSEPAIDVTPFVPQLIVALRDADDMVIARSAQALAHPGAKAAVAIADLVRLLEDRREGVRIGACMGLAGIGPAARDALPALRRALDDPHKDVRHFAKRAIGKIEQPTP
jgi:HEAT repeat protein